MALACSSAFAEVSAPAPKHDLEQYRRTEWDARQGLSAGRIQALAQTQDGYLWVGTAEGLFRFDGFRFTELLTARKLPVKHILELLPDREGVLWVRTQGARIMRVVDGNISAPLTLGQRTLAITAMTLGRSKGIYVTDVHVNVLHLTADNVESLPIQINSLPLSIAQSTDGKMWIGTRDRGLLYWDGSLKSFEAGSQLDRKINCLLSGPDGHLWIGTDEGLEDWDGHELRKRPIPAHGMGPLQILTMMQDRAKNLWLGTSQGLVRYSDAGAEFLATNSISPDTAVTAVVQSRGGDIWFGSGATLERLQSTPLLPVKVAEDAPGGKFGPIYVDPQDRVWFATRKGELYWMEGGVAHEVRLDGLANDEIYSIDGHGDEIWLGRRSHGLTRLRLTHGAIESKTWTEKDGLARGSIYVVRVTPDGTVWAGSLADGLSRWQNGRFTHFDERSGLPSNAVTAIEPGAEGHVWIGTPNGVCELWGEHCARHAAARDQPEPDVKSLLADASGGLWIGSSSGLALLDEDGMRNLQVVPGVQPQILGIGLDQANRLWLAGDHGVMSMSRSSLLQHKGSRTTSYGDADGERSSEGVRRARSVTMDSSGHVWIATARQISMTTSGGEPRVAAIPHIEQVVADGVELGPGTVRVPAGARRLSFLYTGLDLHAPERVRFRYRLDGFDKGWSDRTAERQTTYTNLPPGTYTFRLGASNEATGWNPVEDNVRIIVEPFLWQRWQVRAALAAGLVFLIFLGYRTRTGILLRHANLLADERLRERTRIAREVHDTLLQGFISSLMHLYVADRQLPPESPLKGKLAPVLDGMERVIEEARLAVVGLRTPEAGQEDLESSIRDYFLEVGDLSSAEFRLQSHGRQRRVSPAAHPEILHIIREGVLNAVRHSDARLIQVAITWKWSRLTIEVSDDGRGIDAFTLEHGRCQHFGLTSMRERAERIHAGLKIESESDAGARIVLSIPARDAYLRRKESQTATPASL